jgi:ABC-type multidrug transport system fused ATPase/permease subunit
MSKHSFLEKYFYVLKGKRRQLILMAVLFLTSSILELLGIGLIGPFVGAVVNPGLLDRIAPLNSLMNYLGVMGERDQIIVLGSVLLLIFIIKGVVAYGITRHIYAFTFYFRANLVEKLMKAYLNMPYQFYLERNSAAIVNSVIAHTKTMTDDMLLPSLKLCSDAIVLIAIGLFLFWVDPLAMLVLLVALGGTSAFYFRFVKPGVKAAGQEVAVQNEGLIRGVNQGIGGIKEIRILAAERHFLEHVSLSAKLCADSQKKFYTLIAIPRFLIETVFVIFVVLFALFTLYTGKSGDAMVATLAMFGVAGIRVLPAVVNISSALASMSYSGFALSELYRDLQYVERQSAGSGVAAFSSQSEDPIAAFRQLELDNISYAYPGAGRQAIDGISLAITHGQSIGLIGASGAGKTTLVDILLGLHQFDSGKLTVNGTDITEYGWSNWLQQVAYIPQNVFLADETLEKNIAFGISEESIDSTKVIEALAAAQLSQLVERLPDGVHTMVGERGIRLSGGERQRVALARAFYHNRNVFIFDEATSALDAETERQVIEVIESLHGQKTLIVIAHRLTTVKSCDVIFRLKEGRIIDSGRYEDVVDEHQFV